MNAKGLSLGDRIGFRHKVWLVERFDVSNIGIRSVVDGERLDIPIFALVQDLTFELIGSGRETHITSAIESANLDRISAEVLSDALRLARQLEEVRRGMPYLPDEDPPANFVPRPKYDPKRTTLEQRLKAKSRELKRSGTKISVRTLQRRLQAYEGDGKSVLNLIPRRFLAAQVRDTKWSLTYLDMLARNISDEMEGAQRGQSHILAKTNLQVRGNPDLVHVAIPSVRTQRRLFNVLAAQMGWRLGKRKYVQSRKERPSDTYLPVHPLMPGERVEVDTTLLNVRVFDPVTGRIIRPFLTVPLDVPTRMVIGLGIGFVEDHTVVSHALLDAMTPKPPALVRDQDAYVNRLGVPAELLVELYPGLDPDVKLATGPMMNPTLLVFDQGTPFFNTYTRLLLGRIRTAFEVARGRTPTDKPHVERFFRSLESLLRHLKGYTAEDVVALGKDEKLDPSEFLTLAQLDTIIRTWIATEYHALPHSSLHVPVSRGGTRLVSPMAMYELLIAQHGFIPVPLGPHLRYLLMDTKELTIQDDGIHYRGRIYDSRDLDHVRRARCRWTKSGDWVVHADRSDCREIFMQVPEGDQRVWIKVPWRHKPPAMKFPFPESVMTFLRKHAPIHASDGTVSGWKPYRGGKRLSSIERAERVLDYLEWVPHHISTHQEIGAYKDGKPDFTPEVAALRALVDVVEGTRLQELQRRYLPDDEPLATVQNRKRRRLPTAKPPPDVPSHDEPPEFDYLGAWSVFSGGTGQAVNAGKERSGDESADD